MPKLERDYKLLRELLRQAHVTYAQHRGGCLGMYYQDSSGTGAWPCNCGYRDWAEEVKRLLEGIDGYTEQG